MNKLASHRHRKVAMNAVVPDTTQVSTASPADKARTLAMLRAKLRFLGTATGKAALSLSDAVDRELPWGGLPFGALHEIEGDDSGSAVAFAALILGRAGAAGDGCPDVLWLPQRRGLYAPGLAAYGLLPNRLLVVRTAGDTARLWAMEEALRCRGVAAVLAETGRLAPVAERRLQLAAECGGTLGLLLRGSAAHKNAGNAALTRWRIAAAPSLPASDMPGVGPPRWRADLLHCRGGRPASWLLEWHGSTAGLLTVTENERQIADAA